MNKKKVRSVPYELFFAILSRQILPSSVHIIRERYLKQGQLGNINTFFKLHSFVQSNRGRIEHIDS